MLPELTEIKLPKLGAPPMPATKKGTHNYCYSALFDYIDSCITLSCSPDGIASLLCSCFFDPSVPCNLVGAYFLGVSRAIEPIQSDERIFTALIAQRQPKFFPLAQAAVWSGRLKSILASAQGALPPINLAVACGLILYNLSFK